MEKGKFNGLTRTLKDGSTIFVGKGRDMAGDAGYAISVTRPMETEPPLPTCECKWEGGVMATSILFSPEALDAIVDLRMRLDHAEDLKMLQAVAGGEYEVQWHVMEIPAPTGEEGQ